MFSDSPSPTSIVSNKKFKTPFLALSVFPVLPDPKQFPEKKAWWISHFLQTPSVLSCLSSSTMESSQNPQTNNYEESDYHQLSPTIAGFLDPLDEVMIDLDEILNYQPGPVVPHSSTAASSSDGLMNGFEIPLNHESAALQPSVEADRGVRMMNNVFTLAQWEEYYLQDLIFRYFRQNVPIPEYLLEPIRVSAMGIAAYEHWKQQMQSDWDDQPGRCKRTDGKKWRCSWDVVEGHRYCERHLNHRKKNREHTGEKRSRQHAGKTLKEVVVTTGLDTAVVPIAPSSSCLTVPTDQIRVVIADSSAPTLRSPRHP